MSAGLWKSRTIKVRGFPWLKGEDKEIGVGSLQSRILCEHHNHELSPLDAEAQKVFATLEEIVLQLRTNASLGARNAYRKPKAWYVDGSKFERWSAKFLIGLICAEESNAKWHDTGSEALTPPAWIVRAIFNREDFKEPAGLHFMTGYQADLIDGLGIGPLTHPGSTGIVGGDISFGGFRFLIWLTQEPIKSFSIPAPRGVISELDEAELKYRMELMRFPIRNVVNQKLTFLWNSALQTTAPPEAAR